MHSVSDIERMAESAIKTGFFPGVRTKDEAVTLMTMAQAEGLHPIVGLRMYHIMSGRPVMRAEAMLARFQQAGGRVQWVSVTAEECRAKFTAPGVEGAYEARWTMDMGAAAGLTGNAQWKKYPAAMLKARAISDGIRSSMPAVVVGVYTPEEVSDFEPPAEPARIDAPAPQQQAAASPPEKASPEQVAEIRRMLAELYPPMSDSQTHKRVAAGKWIEFVSRHAGRAVKSAADLTTKEAGDVLDALLSQYRPEPGCDDTKGEENV